MEMLEVLRRAAKVARERGAEYGPPGPMHARIAATLNGLGFTRSGQPLQAMDVSVMMIATKLCRLAETHTHVDSWVDIAGYAAAGGEVSGADEPTAGREPEQPDLFDRGSPLDGGDAGGEAVRRPRRRSTGPLPSDRWRTEREDIDFERLRLACLEGLDGKRCAGGDEAVQQQNRKADPRGDGGFEVVPDKHW